MWTGVRWAGTTRGGVRVLPWLLVITLVLVTLTLVRLYPRSVPDFWGGHPPDSAAREAPLAATAAWRGTLALDRDTLLTATLLPYHAEDGRTGFRSARLRERHDLEAGALWRVVLALEDSDETAPGGLELASVRVRDGSGLALVPLVEVMGDGAPDDPRDPLRALYALPRLSSAGEPQAALWGRTPAGAVWLELVAGERTLELRLDPIELEPGAAPRWFARGEREVADLVPREALDRRDRRIAELEAELERERTRRREREFEWFEYNQALARLDAGRLAAELAFGLDPAYAPPTSGEPQEEAPEPEDEEVAERRARADEIHRSLSTLLRLEGMGGIDLLQVGTLGDGWVGPVLFRTLDERGRLTGSVAAERLRLEANRAARMLTIVLEDGYESSGGQRAPFGDGSRRIVLPYVDPDPWLESMPELFDARDLDRAQDDGVWNLRKLRLELNRLLGLETSSGWYRVRSLGGVLGEELAEVHLEEFDASGRIKRRLFADRLRIRLQSPGILMILEDGATVYGDQKRGFRGGMHRIYLPRAPREEWEAARLPGLEGPVDDGEG